MSAADAEAELVVRAGDRLLIDLPGYDLDTLPPGATGSCCPDRPALDGRWSIDLPAELVAGATALTLRNSSEEVTFSLLIERPRLGRYVRRVPRHDDQRPDNPGRRVSEAWLRACRRFSGEVQEASHLVVRISDPLPEDRGIRSAVDGLLAAAGISP